MTGQPTYGGTYINTSCQKCGGKGSWTTTEQHTFGGITTYHVCDACNGTGWFWQISNGPAWTPPFQPDKDMGLTLMELNGKISRLQDENDALRYRLKNVEDVLWGRTEFRVENGEVIIKTENWEKRFPLKAPTP